MLVLIIDNYDSFTFNLFQQFSRLGADWGINVIVKRNDEISIDEAKNLKPAALVISPGPGGPHNTGISASLYKEFKSAIPILGVCLGHQLIATLSGATISKAPEPVHGKSSMLFHEQNGIFEGLPSPIRLARYHSLIIADKLSPEFQINCRTESGVPMAIMHNILPIYGVQFHPESFLSEGGDRLIDNFLKRCSRND